MGSTERTAVWHRRSVGLANGIVGALLVIAVVTAGGTHLRAQGTPAGDRAALVALYNATDGPNWVDNTNWLTDQPLSQWHGVDSGNGRVVYLNLGANGLSGAFPPELGNLTQLYWMALGANDLSGAIPPELGNLTKLEYLHLGGNDLSGAIPAELGNLTKLGYLHLSGNGLSGAIPPELGNLTKLGYLSARGTGLCAPRDASFQAWLATVTYKGVNCPPGSHEVIDVAVFYTPAFVREYRRLHGYPQFRSEIDLLFAETNSALQASGVDVELALVGLEEVTYVERGYNQDVNNFKDDRDGEMDEIHDSRDRLGADIAVLLSDTNGQAGGIAGDISATASTAFALVGYLHAGIFAHEIGHLIGLGHDRYMYRDSLPGTHYYSFGYVNQRAFEGSAELSTRWRTIMAYGDQCRDAGFSCRTVMRFSSPDQQFRSDPLGIAGDRKTLALDGPADAVRTINDRGLTVASFRIRPEGLDPSAVTVSFDPPEITVAEGESATLKVRLSRSMGHPITVNLSHGTGQFAGGSEGSDYSALPSSVTFGSDQTEVPIEFGAIDDSLVEGAEGVVLEISESNLPWGLIIGSNPTATVSIQDNDVPGVPVVTTDRALSVTEGQTAVATLAATDTNTPASQLTWSIPAGSAGGTDGHLFALSAGGQLAYLAAKDYESPDDADQNGTYEVTVQVTDGQTPMTAAIQVRLLNRNEAPIAAAGADQSNVAEGATVTLAGSGTDPDAGDELTYAWTQTGGTSVTLSDAAVAAPTFTAPTGLTEDATLAFRLSVTDQAGLSHEDSVSVTVKGLPVVTVEAGTTPVTEGTAAAFTVTLGTAAAQALTVAVSVTESGSVVSGTPPVSVSFAEGSTTATLSVPTAGDTVVEADSTVTAALSAGTGYTVGAASAAAVTVEDDDTATFTVSVAPEAIDEGESATLTVAISNGVTFAEDQPIELALAGTVSAADYTVTPTALMLAAGASSVTADLVATDDQEDEQDETVTIAASLAGVSLGSHTVTIHSISHDATLSGLSLNGIDIGTFTGAETSYAASVPHEMSSTTVTATASHPEAAVSIEPGPEVSLAVGANEIAVTVTAEDGQTSKTYTVTVTRERPPLTASFVDLPQRHGGSGSFSFRILFSEAVSISFRVLRDQSLEVTSGDVRRAQRVDGRDDLRQIVIAPSSDADVTVVLPATADCEAPAAVCTADGRPLSNRLEAVVPGPSRPEVSIRAASSPVTEGTAAAFAVTLDEAATAALTVSVSVTESGSMLAGAAPAELAFAAGDTSMTLSVPTAGDTVVEAASTVTASVPAGTGYTVGTASSASVTVEDDDNATFTVSAVPEAIAEGESATLAVAISNAVTFTEDQTVSLIVSGTASASDYAGVPAALTLAAGESSVTATLAASADQEEEEAETVTVTASHGGSAIGSATVTVNSVSHDATLSALSLSGIDIGTFAAGTTVYTAAVANDVSSTTVTATGSHAEAIVSIDPGAAVSLAEGANEVTLTVTAQDGQTSKTYTVTVTRAATPLTASFASLPAEHSGSGTVALRVQFSEPVATSYETLRDSSFSVTNGSVRSARLVEGRSDLWELEIAPSTDADIVVVLPATADCEAAGAVCTEDGKPLSTRLEATVPWAQPELPVISIVAVASPVSEGERVEFTLSRTGPTTEELYVWADVEASHWASDASMKMRFAAGQSSIVGFMNSTDDTFVRDDNRFVWTLRAGEGHVVSAEAASAEVVVEETDEAEFALSVNPAEVSEGESATVRVAITNGVVFEHEQAITLDFSASTAAKGEDYTVSPEALRLGSGASSVTATLTVLADGAAEDAETIAVAARHGGSEIGSATVTIGSSEALPLTARFLALPATHDGETEFTFELRFSEEIQISHVTLRDTAFQVTGGAVRGARLLAPPSNLRWEITAEPSSDAEVVLALPVTTDCAAAGAVCTAGGKALSQRVEATVEGPAAESSAEGFPLAPANSSPSGIWSDGETAWVADLEDARLYAYRRSDGEREPGKDIATGPAPMGLWSDGATLWVAGLAGGLRAHRLADGTRKPWRDLALEANTAPAGVWSDGETAWVSDWLGDTVYAYRLADARRVANRDIHLAGGNLLPVGLWSDGETLWVADWRERMYAYRLADGGRDPRRDIEAGAGDTDPTGLWSGGGTLLSTSWEAGQVRAYRLPKADAGTPSKKPGAGPVARAVSLPVIADPALQAVIGAALGKAPGEAVSPRELTGLEALTARNAGIRDLSGLEQAVSLKELDLGFNPLADLRPLAALPALETLNLDGAATDLQALAPLAGLRSLSLRNSGIDDLWPLSGLTSLAELDLGDNRIADLQPLVGLGNLTVLRADRNLIVDLWPLASLAGLEALELGANRVRDLQPLAGLARLQSLRLDGNGLAELHPLSGLAGLQDLGLAGNAVKDLRALSHLDGLRRLDLRGNPVGDLRPLRALKSLAWVHFGGSRIEDLGPLEGLPGLTVAGRDDRDSPSVEGGHNGRARQQ